MTRTFGTFLFTGVIWAGLVRVIPAGAVRDVLLIGLGLGFAAAYLFLLVRRVRWLLRRQGSVAVQLGLLLFDVLLMVGTFALVYSTTGLLDNASPERQVVHSFPWLSTIPS